MEATLAVKQTHTQEHKKEAERINPYFDRN